MCRIALILFLSVSTLRAALPPQGGVFMLPLSCSELLPDPGPFINFFEAVARGSVTHDKAFSKRMFKILALREKLSNMTDRTREQNPVDDLIKRTLCFYREQKEPLK